MDEIIAATGTKDNDDGEIDYARKKSNLLIYFLKVY
jgi:hypothetical protein